MITFIGDRSIWHICSLHPVSFVIIFSGRLYMYYLLLLYRIGVYGTIQVGTRLSLPCKLIIK